MNLYHQQLEQHLRELKLAGFVQDYQHIAHESAQANRSYTEFLAALVAQEVARREQRRQTRNLSGARFPVLKELATFDFTAIERPAQERVMTTFRRPKV